MSFGMQSMWSADGKLEDSRIFQPMSPARPPRRHTVSLNLGSPEKNRSHKVTTVNCFVGNLRLLLGNIEETDKCCGGPWCKPAFTALRSINRLKAVIRHHHHVVVRQTPRAMFFLIVVEFSPCLCKQTSGNGAEEHPPSPLNNEYTGYLLR
jgi:hypothetical protein